MEETLKLQCLLMTGERKEKIEDYIEDWHWDEESRQFAFELGAYLFDFMDYLQEESGLSTRVVRKHIGNCWDIGILICQYGFHNEFAPKVLEHPPYHQNVFQRKHIATIGQMKSYRSTCRKLKQYAVDHGDLPTKTK